MMLSKTIIIIIIIINIVLVDVTNDQLPDNFAGVTTLNKLNGKLTPPLLPLPLPPPPYKNVSDGKMVFSFCFILRTVPTNSKVFCTVL